ncbi:MAG: tetratricopeptide repeat protein [Candidatus Berkiella sp.]
MTQEQDPRLVQTPVRLSTSKIWQIQRNYFSSMGINAWKSEVPFYISSNAFIGQRYAALVVNYIKDWLNLHPEHASNVFHILEVGSGTGKFSFYFLKSLKKLLVQNKLNHIKFCYIISDIIENNINFCLENSSFKEYIERGEIDFSNYDVENDVDFHLKLKDCQYSQLDVKTPLIVIANYTFDCIKHDEFEYQDGKFYEVKLGIQSRYKNFDVDKSMHLDDLRFHFERVDVSASIENYYENKDYNKILLDYPKFFTKKKVTRIMMPLCAFEFLDNLKKMTQNNVFLIVGDKGVSQPERFSLLGEKYRYSYDGCYSFLVNFHAIGEYAKLIGGDYLLTNNSNDFKVNLYGLGASFDDFPQTTTYFNEDIQSIGPEEYVYFYDEYLTSSFRFTLKSLLAFVRFSEWDPDAYAGVHDRLFELLPIATAQFIEDLKDDLDKVINNIYNINLGEDVYNLAGMIFQVLDEDDKAVTLYNQSLAVFGDRADPHSNLGMIYEKKKNPTKAIEHYSKVVELDKKNRYARNKLNLLTGKPYFAMITPILRGLLVLGFIAGTVYIISH